jgi:diaminopimelate decarboxylase
VDITQICDSVSTPAYIYSAAHFRSQFNLFAQNFPNALIAFAVKSCSNIAILKLLAQLGCGADIVSEGEMRRALKAGIPSEKIMFSGVGKTEAEILFALNHNVGMLNVESEAEIDVITKVAARINKVAPISLRINPDVVTETLPGISTGKKGDKFGIPQNACLEIFKKYASSPYLNFSGIDFHIGSQVLNVMNFDEAFAKIRNLILQLKTNGYTIQHLDCGGGLGVPYNPEQSSPDIKAYADLVNRHFSDLDVRLAFEPGRFISANAGILVSKILYHKSDDDWHCLVVDAAMNNLMRPAMYDAYHHIVPVILHNERENKIYDIVGPICESTDTFAKSRTLPQMFQGELIAFLSGGAYGASMMSNYNTRLDIPEILVDNNTWNIIRHASTYDDLFRLEVY